MPVFWVNIGLVNGHGAGKTAQNKLQLSASKQMFQKGRVNIIDPVTGIYKNRIYLHPNLF
jgi:hypothetical protein